MTAQGPAEFSKSQRAYRWIKERIARHEYTPGYRLVLGTIAGELDMSVVPVREAVRQLEAEGLVTFERNVGARVTIVDESEYVHTMQTLGIVEGSATALSAPLLTPDDLERAADVNERMRRTLDHFDPHVFTQLNQQFHSVLYETWPNPRCSISCTADGRASRAFATRHSRSSPGERSTRSRSTPRSSTSSARAPTRSKSSWPPAITAGAR